MIIIIQVMELNFRKWLKWYGKTCSPFQLIKGDFLEEQHVTLMRQSTVIFVNNKVFKPDLNHKLKLHFAELKDAVTIISSSPFSPLNLRISDRNVNGNAKNQSHMIKQSSFYLNTLQIWAPSWT